jgi:septal ring factor EnvC (AmiA/AmiB activator)
MHRVGVLIVLGLGALGAIGAARADMYRCEVPGSNVPLYTNDSRDTAGRKCVVVSREVNVVPSQGAKPAAKTASPAGFPKESAAGRAAAKAKQLETLEKELSQEEQMLADAKRKLAAQEAIRTGDEKNYARVLERLQPFKDAVAVHEKNIEALKREINNLYR